MGETKVAFVRVKYECNSENCAKSGETWVPFTDTIQFQQAMMTGTPVGWPPRISSGPLLCSMCAKGGVNLNSIG